MTTLNVFVGSKVGEQFAVDMRALMCDERKAWHMALPPTMDTSFIGRHHSHNVL